MKKALLVILAVALVFQSAQASSWRGQDKSMTTGDFFCGLLGGLASGAIAHNAIGKDPVTLIIGFIGAAAGVNFCQYLRDEEKQTLRLLVDQGFNGELGQTVRVKTSQYDAFITTKREGYRTNYPSDEGVQNNVCRFFEASIYRSSGEFLGRSRGWACKEPNGTWVVVDGRTVRQERYVSTRPGVGSGIDQGGTIGIGGGGGSGSVVPSPVPTTAGQNAVILNWDIRQAPRMVQDGSYERPLQLLNRQSEIGFFKSASRDGSGVQIYVNGNGYNPFVSVDNFGIECGVTPFCPIRWVKTTDGVIGKMKFLFRNGDIGIEISGEGSSEGNTPSDGRSLTGIMIRPLSSVIQ